ncbi:MAG: SDR family oxidoreductase [Spirochaetales bacterium]|nr:SDR family oxidoreductase [Spirochaetales bacterium]
MKGNTALITGAARRIGRALALGCAQKGIHLVLHYHSSVSEAEETAQLAEAYGVRVFLFKSDLASPEKAAELFRNARKSAGNIDILINNASFFRKDTLETLSADSLVDNIMLHALTPLVLSRSIAAGNRGGKIINILDARITDYDSEHAAYHISKRVLYDLTRMMAVEFAPHVTVNGIAPGLILPPPGEDISFLEKMKHTNPLNRHGGPADIVDTALFFLESSFITGQVIFVDGGRHLKGCMYGN